MTVRARAYAMYGFLIALNLAAWALALAAFHAHPVLLGTALLAYTFGLRHAVDADHISAIDNVVRKLMQERKRPVAVGFFFSLGHSTVVVALTIAIAIAATVVKTRLPAFQSIGSLVGTSVSAIFLLSIAAINLFVLVDVIRAFRAAAQGEPHSESSVDATLEQRGLMGRFFRPLFKMVGSSRSMYPIGLLFGLGFDTATEVGLLAIAAVEAGHGLPVYDVLLFPLLFTAGMSLVDTTDGILMLGAYGWAFLNPLRKLYYNVVVTLVSVLVALVVGGIEAANVVGLQLNLTGGIWDGLRGLGENFGTLGAVIVAIFILSWGISTVIYRLRGYDSVTPPLSP